MNALKLDFSKQIKMYRTYLTICLILAAIRISYTHTILENIDCPNYKHIEKRSTKTNFVLQKADVYANPTVREFQSTIAEPSKIIDDELSVQIIDKNNAKDQIHDKFKWNHDKDSVNFMERPLIVSRFREDANTGDFETRMFDISIDDNLISTDRTRNLDEISNVPLAEDEGDGSKLFYIELDEMISGNKKDNNINREKTLKKNLEKSTEIKKTIEKKCENNDDLLDLTTVETVTEILDENVTNCDENIELNGKGIDVKKETVLEEC